LALKKVSLYNGIDIFSGAGGMSIGAEMAGISVSVAVENNAYAAQTFAYNHPNAKIIVDDITNVSTENLNKKPVFVLFGGPPCQGFSLSNTKTRTSENPNNSLFEQYLRFVRELSPQWLVFENVEGFNNFQKGLVVKELEKRLSDLGYTTTKKILWASDYGVPQNRNRFFLVANRLGLNYEFPGRLNRLNRKVTVQEAICDLPVLSNGDSFFELPYKTDYQNDYTKLMRAGSDAALQNFVSRNKDYVIERYKHVKQGENWRSIPADLMGNYSKIDNTHSGIYKRLDPNTPSVVIANYRKNMLIHPFEDRGLSVREAARLQSFPDTFVFKGSLMHIQQQIGNAVPPLLAKAVFDSIILTMNDRKSTNRTSNK
jgi:DNA (cytosine-5)-methyltransferase 1